MKTIKGNVIYFHDPMDEPEPEMRIIQREFHDAGFELPSIIETDLPPFMGASNERGYDILLFDWGGMSLGNSLLSHFCEEILDEALECPNRTYIMTSYFTKEAMDEAKESFDKANGSVPPNVFLSVKDYCNYLSKE